MRTRFLAVLLATAPLCSQAVLATVEANQTLIVKAQVDGLVARVAVAMGDAVKGLDPLLVIGNAALSAEYGALDLEMARRQAQLDAIAEAAKVAATEKKLAERAVKSSGAELPIARQRLEFAQAHAATLKTLYQSGRSNQLDFHQAQLTVAAAEASVRAAERLVLDAQDQLLIAEAKAAQAGLAVNAQRHFVESARAQRDGVDVRVRQCEVKCVLNEARVHRVFVGKGDVVAVGDRLLELVDASKLRVVLRLPPQLAITAAIGTPVHLKAAGSDDLVPGAKITRLGVAIEGDGCLPAIVEVAPTPGLYPGLEIRAELAPMGKQ